MVLIRWRSRFVVGLVSNTEIQKSGIRPGPVAPVLLRDVVERNKGLGPLRVKNMAVQIEEQVASAAGQQRRRKAGVVAVNRPECRTALRPGTHGGVFVLLAGP
jgi:hypothetical protein